MKAPCAFVQVVVLGSILATLAPAQQFDTLLFFPDTLGSLYAAQLLPNPLTGRVYGVNYDGDVQVFDPALLQRVRRFPGLFQRGIYCSQVAKFYFAGEDEESTLTTVDARTDTASRPVMLGRDWYPMLLAYSSTSAKLYVGSWYEPPGIVDVNSDSLVRTLNLEGQCYNMIWDSATNRLFVSGSLFPDPLQVFDCTTDSLIGSVPLRRAPRCYAIKPAGRKLFCYTQYDTMFDTLYVVSTQSLTVNRRLTLPAAVDTLVYNPLYDRVYALGGDQLSVIDASTDSLRRWFTLPGRGRSIAWSPADGRVYVGTDSDQPLVIIDQTDTIVSQVRLRSGAPVAMGASVERGELYVALANGLVAVVAIPADTVTGYVDYRDYTIRNLCHDPAGNKLYLLMPYSDQIAVLGSDYRVLKYIEMPGLRSQAFPLVNPALGRLYVADRRLLTVIDCSLDSVLRGVPISTIDDPVVVLHPDMNRLFVVPTDGDTSALVYDCAGDSFIASIPLGGEAVFATYQPLFDKLYVGVYADPNLTVIDAARCSVVGRTSIGSRNRSVRAFAHPGNGLLYLQHPSYDSVWLLDCSTDSVVGAVVNQVSTDTILWNVSLDKLYLSNRFATVVLDCPSNTVVGNITAGTERAGLMNDSTGKLYLGRQVVSCQSDSLIAGLTGIGTPYNFALSPVDSRVFVSCRQSYLAVYRDEPGGIEESDAPVPLRLGLGANPVRYQALLRAHVPPGQTAELSVVDVSGRVVLRQALSAERRVSGVVLDLRLMPAGVYFARLEAGAQRSTVKFVLQR